MPAVWLVEALNNCLILRIGQHLVCVVFTVLGVSCLVFHGCKIALSSRDCNSLRLNLSTLEAAKSASWAQERPTELLPVVEPLLANKCEKFALQRTRKFRAPQATLLLPDPKLAFSFKLAALRNARQRPLKRHTQ